MTVNEMIAELERERADGHGLKQVKIWMWEAEGEEQRQWTRPVSTVLYCGLRPYDRDFVEIV